MEKIKLICMDVDGTLVNDQKIIPDYNIEVIRRSYNKGLHIAILSGRIEPSVRHYMDILGIKGAVPSLGGCLIRDYDYTIIQENLVNQKAALGILEIAKRLNCTFFYYYRDIWAVETGHDYWLESEQKATGLRGIVTDLEKEILKQTPNKILGVNSDASIVLKLKNEIEQNYNNYVDCVLSTPWFLEIVPKNVNKGSAILKLCEHYSIEPKNVLAIGDYYNDVDMFKVAGVSVSMANAPDDIKKLTSYTTKNDNGHCGVAEAIENLT